MRFSIRTIAISIFLIGLGAGCKKNLSDTNSKSNKLMGDIYDANGNKFAINDATVTVEVWDFDATGGGDYSYDIEMDGNGHYEQKVESGSYTYDARASMLLNGKRVTVQLEPLDGQPADAQFESGPGVTRDFKLSLTGVKPGEDPTDPYSYYGGHVSVRDGALNSLAVKYPGYTINFRLTGSSNCIDGSVSPILDIPCAVENLQGAGTYLVNIPLAKYFITALLRSPTGQQYPLKLSFVGGVQGNHYNFLDIGFSPSPTDPNNWPSTMYVEVWEN